VTKQQQQPSIAQVAAAAATQSCHTCSWEIMAFAEKWLYANVPSLRSICNPSYEISYAKKRSSFTLKEKCFLKSILISM
jgi:hypothetical protein